jgi:hypothetical protein
MADEPVVSYPISEVLKEISAKIDRLFDALASKVDKAEFDALAAKVETQGTQLQTVLTANVNAATDQRNRQQWRQWIIPVLLSVLTIIVAALQVWRP